MVPDKDKKPAAPSPSSVSSPSKRRKTMEETYDVADQLGFRSGDQFEVKWIIRDEDDDYGIEGAAAGNNPEEVAADDDNAGGITVWWSATLIRKTDRMHTLADMTEGESPQFAVPVVKVPIYELKYEPMQGKDRPMIVSSVFHLMSPRSLIVPFLQRRAWIQYLFSGGGSIYFRQDGAQPVDR